MATASELAQSWLQSGGGKSSPGSDSASSNESLAAGPAEEMSPATDDQDTEVLAENSTVDDFLAESGDTPSDSSKSPKDAKAASNKEKPTSETSAKEVITVTDEKGQKRKVEIDFSDRERIRKAFSMESGARKWQAERDAALNTKKQAEAKLGEIQGNWNKLDEAYQQSGLEGMYDLVKGPGAFKQHVAKQVEKALFLQKASPAEREQLLAQEAQELSRQELDKLRKDNEDFKKQVVQEREVAETRSLESKIHPVFEKYRFADKLGDSNDEHIFDQMLWKTSMDRLEEAENAGVDVTPELIHKEFSEVAQRIRKRIGVQAEKKASKVIETKKREATENVQSKMMSGYKSGSLGQEARDLINNGNLTGLMKNWGKYGGLFQKK